MNIATCAGLNVPSFINIDFVSDVPPPPARVGETTPVLRCHCTVLRCYLPTSAVLVVGVGGCPGLLGGKMLRLSSPQMAPSNLPDFNSYLFISWGHTPDPNNTCTCHSVTTGTYLPISFSFNCVQEV